MFFGPVKPLFSPKSAWKDGKPNRIAAHFEGQNIKQKGRFNVRNEISASKSLAFYFRFLFLALFSPSSRGNSARLGCEMSAFGSVGFQDQTKTEQPGKLS